MFGTVYRYHKKPRMKAQKMENLSIAFSFMLDVEHIPLVNIGKYIVCHYGDNLLFWNVLQVHSPNF